MPAYTCPWCPTTVFVVDDADDARRWMEAHLDGHFSQPIGRPEVAA